MQNELRTIFIVLTSVALSALPVAAQDNQTCFGLEPTIVGSGGDDVIEGTEGDDVIVALGGDDQISHLGGQDRICGGKGKDSIDADGSLIRGGLGNDNLSGYQSAIFGQLGADTIETQSGTIHGGRGGDTINAGGRLYGGAGDDHITGSGDELDPRPFDILCGGKGNDTLVGMKQFDEEGEEVGDKLRFDCVDRPVEIEVAEGRARGQGRDSFSGLFHEIYASLRGDVVRIGRARAGIYALAGSDVVRGSGSLDGGGGDDRLIGGSHHDWLFGRRGDDFLDGRGRPDHGDGGPGQDICVSIRNGPRCR